MRAVTKPIVLAVAGVLGLGLVTAAAADSHGAVVSALAKAKTLNSQPLIGRARGEAVSDLAMTNGRGKNGSSPNGGGAKANDVHGDNVSGVPKGAEASHEPGAKPNHGGAVILVSRKPDTR